MRCVTPNSPSRFTRYTVVANVANEHLKKTFKTHFVFPKQKVKTLETLLRL